MNLELIIPELVFTNEVDGYKGVHYPEISALLIEAIKEQQQIIESQNHQIESLENRLEKLENLVESKLAEVSNK